MGWRTNFALKRLMLDHAFRSFPEVWFHIAPSNLRSQKATARLGATHVRTASLDLSGTPADWMCYRLTRPEWQAAIALRDRGVDRQIVMA